VGTRLGLLGGTFDPIHVAHLFMGAIAADDLDLAKVLLMPAGIPPHKRGGHITAHEHRLAMVHAAVDGDPLFEVSDLEMRRNAPSYTIETVRELLEIRGAETELFLIMGSDSLLELHTWKDHSELLSLVRLAVYPRPGFDPGSIDVIPRDRVNLLSTGGLDFRLSSTTIRERAAAGRSIRFLVPHAVEKYIVDNDLYGEP
jgi:nicotinate-nucleotide adenylyltransferase